MARRGLRSGTDREQKIRPVRREEPASVFYSTVRKISFQ